VARRKQRPLPGHRDLLGRVVYPSFFFVVLMWVFAGFGLVSLALLITRNQFDLNQSFTRSSLLLTPVFLTLALLLTALLFRGWNR